MKKVIKEVLQSSNRNDHSERKSSRYSSEEVDLRTRRLQALLRGALARRERLWRRQQKLVRLVLDRPDHAPLLALISSSRQIGNGVAKVDRPRLVDAALSGDIKHVRRLLEEQTSPDSHDDRGMGALHAACGGKLAGTILLDNNSGLVPRNGGQGFRSESVVGSRL